MLLARKSQKRCYLFGLAFLLLAIIFLSLRVGSIGISANRIFTLLANHAGWELAPVTSDHYDEAVLWTILWSIRVPRVLLALLVGAALAVAGAGMQGLFRNPLADPSLIGVSAGAAMGAVLVIVLGDGFLGWLIVPLGVFALPFFAFLGGLGMTYIIYQVSKFEGRTSVANMLLAGIAVNALAASFVGFVILVSNKDELRDFVFWSLGSLSGASWKSLASLAPLILLPLFVFPFYGRILNAFLLGEAEAFHLGINTQRAKTVIIFLSAAMVGATVSVCGIIGFVGLVIPHIVRLSLGPDHRYLIPGSALLGGILVAGTDLLARWLMSPLEIPIGIITALLGGPFFMGLVYFSKSRIWE